MKDQGKLRIINERVMTVRLVHAAGFPQGFHGAVYPIAPGKYTILLNNTDTDQQQAESFLHECLHIYHGDLEREGVNVDRLEAERHAELATILPALQ